jgi:hypothetical protein
MNFIFIINPSCAPSFREYCAANGIGVKDEIELENGLFLNLQFANLKASFECYFAHRPNVQNVMPVKNWNPQNQYVIHENH